MKYLLISDNTETLTGFRLAGVEGIPARTPQEVGAAIEAALSDGEVGILILTQKAADMQRETVERIKLDRSLPIAVEIPDRHGYEGTLPIERYINEAVGMG